MGGNCFALHYATAAAACSCCCCQEELTLQPPLERSCYYADCILAIYSYRDCEKPQPRCRFHLVSLSVCCHGRLSRAVARTSPLVITTGQNDSGMQDAGLAPSRISVFYDAFTRSCSRRRPRRRTCSKVTWSDKAERSSRYTSIPILFFFFLFPLLDSVVCPTLPCPPSSTTTS